MQTVSFSNCFRSFETEISDYEYGQLKAGSPFNEVFNADFIRNLNIRFYGKPVNAPYVITVWKGTAFGADAELLASS